jgi:hypothetical protein
VANKIPALDSISDALQTLVRIPGGAALAANSPVAKTRLRAAVNASPEPFSNIALSLLGDAAEPSALRLASAHPGALLVLVAIDAVLMATL